jgi:hypothetical protein
MSQIATFGIILLAMAAVVIFADYLIDAWYDWVDRRSITKKQTKLRKKKTASPARVDNFPERY